MPALAVRYRDRLPIGTGTPLVSLGEGGTPLVHAPRLSEELGLELWLKVEGANPTGSFKDRGMTIAVAKALEAGASAVICASTGNTAASAAAYAARAGLRAVVLVPAGGVPAGKLFQSAAAGARLLEVRGSFDQALAAAQELASGGEFALVNSVNPDRLEGQKTAAFEIVEELGVPDLLALPYGGGGNTVAYAKGFLEAGFPKLEIVPVQAADRATTSASAIRIPTPVHRAEVDDALARRGGTIVSVTDDEIAVAWRSLARHEGIFCEPASAAALAGVDLAGLAESTRVVFVLTGHGLKDPDTALGKAPAVIGCEADLAAVERIVFAD
jgi:threonine synthase